MKATYWYLSTLYRKHPGGPEKAYSDACKLTAYFIRSGTPVFSPIVHSHPLTKIATALACDYYPWLQLDEHYLEGAYGLFVATYRHWDESEGVNFEIDYMKRMGRPVVYFDPYPILKAYDAEAQPHFPK